MSCGLPLHLLGQRFGVLAAAPAFDAERVPLGPWSLCTQLHEASAVLQLSHESQLLLLRTFERYPYNIERADVIRFDTCLLAPACPGPTASADSPLLPRTGTLCWPSLAASTWT